MKCPKCGTTARPLYQNLPNHLCERCDKTLIHYIDPSELKRLIEAAETNGATISNMLYAMKDYCFHDDQSALRRLAGGEE